MKSVTEARLLRCLPNRCWGDRLQGLRSPGRLHAEETACGYAVQLTSNRWAFGRMSYLEDFFAARRTG